ncbi:hypothetical protein R80B4_00392 [Fibrobacteres bacterium R8-0-B4]
MIPEDRIETPRVGGCPLEKLLSAVLPDGCPLAKALSGVSAGGCQCGIAARSACSANNQAEIGTPSAWSANRAAEIGTPSAWSANRTAEIGTVKLSRFEKKILEAAKKDEHATYAQLIRITRASHRTIARGIKKLTENNIIARSGSDKRVTWKVLKPS